MFNAGRGLHELDTVLLAGAACEIHPNALKQAVERQAIKDRLKEATDEAIERGRDRRADRRGERAAVLGRRPARGGGRGRFGLSARPGG